MNEIGNKISVVTPGLYRGPRLRREELEILKPATIINLENDTTAVSNEEGYCRSKSIAFLHMPLSEFFPPSPQKLINRVCLIVASLKPGYIHCLHGVDRTGFVVAAYRMIVERWSLEMAYQECLDMGHHVCPYWWWKRSLLNLEKVINR